MLIQPTFANSIPVVNTILTRSNKHLLPPNDRSPNKGLVPGLERVNPVPSEPSYGHYPLPPWAVTGFGPKPATIDRGSHVGREVDEPELSTSTSTTFQPPRLMAWKGEFEIIADLARGAELTCPSTGPRLKIGRLCGALDAFTKSQEYHGESKPNTGVLHETGWSTALQLIGDLTQGIEFSCPEGAFRMKVGRLRSVIDHFVETYPGR